MVLQGILKVTLGTQGKKRFKADGGIGENVYSCKLWYFDYKYKKICGISRTLWNTFTLYRKYRMNFY